MCDWNTFFCLRLFTKGVKPNTVFFFFLFLFVFLTLRLDPTSDSVERRTGGRRSSLRAGTRRFTFLSLAGPPPPSARAPRADAPRRHDVGGPLDERGEGVGGGEGEEKGVKRGAYVLDYICNISKYICLFLTSQGGVHS